MIHIAFCQTNHQFILLERAEKEIHFSVANWTFKMKWTSIATVPELCPTTVKILTHLISRYHPPLKTFFWVSRQEKIYYYVKNVVSTNELKTRRTLGKCHNQNFAYIVQGIRQSDLDSGPGFYKTKEWKILPVKKFMNFIIGSFNVIYY